MTTKPFVTIGQEVAIEQAKWAKADAAWQKMNENYISFGQELHQLQEGGTTQQAIAERYDIAQSAVAQAIAVGVDPRFAQIIAANDNQRLPRSARVLYELTTITNEADFKRLCQPETTQKVIRDYKNKPAKSYPGVAADQIAAYEANGCPVRPTDDHVWDSDQWILPVPEAKQNAQAVSPPPSTTAEVLDPVVPNAFEAPKVKPMDTNLVVVFKQLANDIAENAQMRKELGKKLLGWYNDTDDVIVAWKNFVMSLEG